MTESTNRPWVPVGIKHINTYEASAKVADKTYTETSNSETEALERLVRTLGAELALEKGKEFSPTLSFAQRASLRKRLNSFLQLRLVSDLSDGEWGYLLNAIDNVLTEGDQNDG